MFCAFEKKSSTVVRGFKHVPKAVLKALRTDFSLLYIYKITENIHVQLIMHLPFGFWWVCHVCIQGDDRVHESLVPDILKYTNPVYYDILVIVVVKMCHKVGLQYEVILVLCPLN